MRECKQCQCQMEEGYRFKVNTYGVISVDQKETKEDEIKVAICPTCGEISIYLDKSAKK